MNKKEKYIKNKKLIRSFLGLGTTIAIIGIYSLISKFILPGLIALIIGLFVLFLAFRSKKITLEIEKYCLNKCPICDDEIVKTEEVRYYVGDNLVDEETFNSQKNNKIKRNIYYYKCEKSNFCMTVIKSNLYTINKEKPLNDKVQLDFDYNGDY